MIQDFRLLTEHSLWLAPVALLAGLGYALLLYYGKVSTPFSRRATVLLFLFRFLVVSLIAGLLLGPFFRQSRRTIQQPRIIFLHDNSVSVAANDTTGEFAARYQSRIGEVVSSLSKGMQPVHYVFGSRLADNRMPRFEDERTNLAEALTLLPGLFYRQNVGALVLLSDGIHNAGIDPLLPAGRMPFPVYTVGLGDTNTYPDLAIADVRYNRVVWSNSEFPVEVYALARDAAGSKVSISLLMDGKLIGRAEALVGAEGWERAFTFQVREAPSGQRRFLVEITGLENERVTSNNRREFFVEVMGQKQRILLLAASPHPDLGAIQAAASDYYELEVAYANAWSGMSTVPDLLILHELPVRGGNAEPLIALIQQNPRLPVWFINGPRTDEASFNRMQEVYRMRPFSQDALADAFAWAEKTFGLFSMEEDKMNRIPGLPALNARLSDWEILAPAVPLFRQRLRGVETAYPLWSFYESPARRMAFVTGTGLWRWRLADFQRNGNNDAVNDIIRKTINYLIIRPEERRLRLFTENVFSRNDEVSFRAELYNQTMELVNEPELLMTITGQDVKFDYAFYRTEKSDYRLNIGRLPPGDYSYLAQTTLAGEVLTREGRFSVASESPELRNLQANHRLLRSISALTGGKFIHFDQIDELAQLLRNDKRITSTASFSLDFSPVLGQLWALVLLLVLLSVEWLLRKYLGSY